MKIRSHLKTYAGAIEVAAIIDVVFLLLIFFMLNSTRVFHPGIPVELPQSQTSSQRTAQKIIITLVQAEDDDEQTLVFFNDNQVEWKQLERRLAELVYESRVIKARRTPDSAEKKEEGELAPMVVLRADKRVDYRKVVKIMSLARSLNLSVYLATDTPRGEYKEWQERLP